MLKNKPIYVFALILIAIIIVAISVVVSQYNKNKPIVPDKSMEVLSSNDMLKIKQAYNTQEKKQEFITICKTIELAVANKLLDGTVTNDSELASAIENINNMFKTDDWSELGLESSTYWMGEWKLDDKGMITFTFQTDNIKPDWSQDEDVEIYIK